MTPARGAPSTSCPDTTTYNNPSPALQPLRDTHNLAFVYGSTAVEAWLLNRTEAKMKEAAAAGLQLPGSTASYYRSGSGFTLFGTNKMTQPEKDWWKDHGQEIVDTMAAPSGPDIVVLHARQDELRGLWRPRRGPGVGPARADGLLGAEPRLWRLHRTHIPHHGRHADDPCDHGHRAPRRRSTAPPRRLGN
jgi:hypothetical protein